MPGPIQLLDEPRPTKATEVTTVLGVDSSLNSTGLCRVELLPWPPSRPFRQADEPVQAKISVSTLSTFKCKEKTKREYSRRVTRVIEQIEEAMDGVGLVAIEELAYGAKGEATWVLPWIWGRVIDLCEKHDIPVITVSTTAVKKYVTGNGGCKKEIATLAIVRRWPEVEIVDNNQADALVVAAMGCRYLDLPIDSVPKANYQSAMAKLSA